MILVRDQSEQIDDVDESDLDPGQVFLEQGGSSQSFGGDDITDTAHDNVGFLSGQARKVSATNSELKASNQTTTTLTSSG